MCICNQKQHTDTYLVIAWLMIESVQVRSNGLIVFVPKFGIEGPVFLTSKEDSKNDAADKSDYVLDEELQTIKSQKEDASFTVSILAVPSCSQSIVRF